MPGPIISKEKAASGVIQSIGDERTYESAWEIFQRREGTHEPMDRTGAELALRMAAPYAVPDPFFAEMLFAQDYIVEMIDSHRASGTVSYRVENGIDNVPPAVPGEDWAPPNFRIFGETINARQSLETTERKARPGKTAKNYKQLVGVDREGDIKGADILRTKMQFSIPRVYPMAVMSRGWLAALKSITNTVCSHSFLGQDRGEMFFLGAEGGPNYAKRRIEVNLHFLCSSNESGVVIGDIALSNPVFGHEHVWCGYVTDDAAGVRATVPEQVNVERMYRFAAWYPVLGFQ